MHKTIIALISLILFAANIVAQSENQAISPGNPDGVREFVLNKTTVDEIINS